MTVSRANRDLQLGDKKVTLNHLAFVDLSVGFYLNSRFLFLSLDRQSFGCWLGGRVGATTRFFFSVEVKGSPNLFETSRLFLLFGPSQQIHQVGRFCPYFGWEDYIVSVVLLFVFPSIFVTNLSK